MRAMADEDKADQGSKQDAVAGANMNDIASVDNENSTLSEALVAHMEGRITKDAYKAVQNMVKISKNISKVMSAQKIAAGQEPMKVDTTTMFTLRFDKGGRSDVRGNADLMRVEGSVEKVKQGEVLSVGDRLEYLRTSAKGSVWYKATIEKMVTSNPTMYMIHFDKGDNVEVRYVRN